MNYLPPKEDYIGFRDEAHYEEKCREWTLGGKNVKREFTYKSRDGEHMTMVTIDGYEVNGNHETLVIRFANDQLTCIHPAYLKEMQKGDFGKESMIVTSEEQPKKATPPVKKVEAKPAPKAIVLPEEKVSFKATIKELTTRYNHFADKEEEIIIYEDVTYDENTNIGLAYSSVTKALSALELQPGDSISFDAKVVSNKKLNKEVLYKINNPSKLVKL